MMTFKQYRVKIERAVNSAKSARQAFHELGVEALKFVEKDGNVDPLDLWLSAVEGMKYMNSAKAKEWAVTHAHITEIKGRLRMKRGRPSNLKGSIEVANETPFWTIGSSDQASKKPSFDLQAKLGNLVKQAHKRAEEEGSKVDPELLARLESLIS